MPKGSGKSPLGAAIACLSSPPGAPDSQWVRLAAYSEDQAVKNGSNGSTVTLYS